MVARPRAVVRIRRPRRAVLGFFMEVGLAPTFCFRESDQMYEQRIPGGKRLDTLVRPSIAALGYELVGIDYRPARGGATLRLYIDSDDGITVDDCERVSHQVSGVLDVADPIPGHYTLEVSSPGLDRPLFTPADYARFAGQEVRLRVRETTDGRHTYTGTLTGVREDVVVIEEDGVEVSFPMESIARANLVPRW